MNSTLQSIVKMDIDATISWLMSHFITCLGYSSTRVKYNDSRD